MSLLSAMYRVCQWIDCLSSALRAQSIPNCPPETPFRHNLARQNHSASSPPSVPKYVDRETVHVTGHPHLLSKGHWPMKNAHAAPLPVRTIGKLLTKIPRPSRYRTRHGCRLTFLLYALRRHTSHITAIEDNQDGESISLV